MTGEVGYSFGFFCDLAPTGGSHVGRVALPVRGRVTYYRERGEEFVLSLHFAFS